MKFAKQVCPFIGNALYIGKKQHKMFVVKTIMQQFATG